MTNAQLYLAVGVPSILVLLGILLNFFQYNSLRTEIRTEINGLRAEMISILTELRADINLLTGKVIELVDRLSRLEAR
ncbi:MAG TPA: hypothetical protein VGD64_16405 [Acidisarcina sp.]